MEPLQAASFAGFLAQTDAIGRTVIVVLAAMSLATWYFIITKSIQIIAIKRRAARFLESFWNAPSMQAVAVRLAERAADEPFSRLAQRAIASARHHQRHGAHRLDEAGSASEFLLRAMRRVIDEETARLESGLTIVAELSAATAATIFGILAAHFRAARRRARAFSAA